MSEDQSDLSTVEPSRQQSAQAEGDAFRHKFVLVTWSQSRIENAQEFHRLLLKALPVDTEVFGCKALREDGNPHYHAVLRLATRPNWRNARQKFFVLNDEGTVDTTAVRLSPPENSQREGHFLEQMQRYCEKFEDAEMFGTRMEVLSAKQARKRAYLEIAEDPDFESAKKRLRMLDPERFMRNYLAYMAYLQNKKDRGPLSG
jgi:hypothetical protein